MPKSNSEFLIARLERLCAVAHNRVKRRYQADMDDHRTSSTLTGEATKLWVELSRRKYKAWKFTAGAAIKE